MPQTGQINPKWKWIAALLLVGYLLGKVLTFYAGYRVIRYCWWRFGSRTSPPSREDAEPLLGDGDREHARNGVGHVISSVDVLPDQLVKCEVRVHEGEVVVKILRIADQENRQMHTLQHHPKVMCDGTSVQVA
ncbi:hypothetical protein VaNZ11_015114 [Volvox africanus]|uniref:Uncharacterized protein n=1 Tax=Volvox africanus TaxID=51714 RepID=A0ABQ5SM91_9CHLO|nr:hypothetical protein VaNZ11_015114 [Volvox africanus]